MNQVQRPFCIRTDVIQHTIWAMVGTSTMAQSREE